MDAPLHSYASTVITLGMAVSLVMTQPCVIANPLAGYELLP
jgi:hypothetical protein